MTLKAQKLKITDDLGNDLLADVSISNLSQSLIKKVVEDIEAKRNEAFINRLKELNIEFDPEIEQHRRFKRFTRDIQGDEEIIYYNDGSMSGLRVITFKTVQEPFNLEKFSIGYTVSYY